MRNTQFAVRLFSQIELDVCLAVEGAIATALNAPPHQTLARLIQAYPKGYGVDLARADTDKLLGAFDAATFDATLGDVLEGRMTTTTGRVLGDRESDLAVVYGIRNKAAHRLERPAAAAEEFNRVLPRLFFAVFAAIEAFYA